jgi:hypothetical protein
MKHSTQKMVIQFPHLEEKLQAWQEGKSKKSVVEGLGEIEYTFFKLACFFEDPKNHEFNLQWVFQNLQDERLELSLELMIEFFRKDTYLIQQPTFSLIREGED